MILEKQTEANIETTGGSQDSIGMSLDMESAQVLMQMLSKNLYSDAVGSTIRECASNALDSHRRAGVTDPIIVSLAAVNGQYEFSVEDFGIGLDAEDVKNIISKYGKSTKRDSTTELGMMGLGFKAPLAYSSSFYFTCRKNGVERKYMMYEGEDTNTIDLLYEKPTTERNGVKVIVPIKYGDKYEFERKIGEQLAYFKDVYFNVPGMNNEFLIHRTEHFQFSELCQDKMLHICLDDVYYPIDFDKLGIDKLHFPVGMRFGLSDSIFPTPNREAIRYTKEAKTAIMRKITKVADFFVDKYNEQAIETSDIKYVIDYYSSSNRYITTESMFKDLDISRLAVHSTKTLIAPKLEGITHLDLEKHVYDVKHLLLGEYEAKHIIYNDRMKTCSSSWMKTVELNSALNEKHGYRETIHYMFSERVSATVRDYLKSIHPRSEVKLIKKVREYKLKGTTADNYMRILGLKNYPKNTWRARIKEFQKIQSMVLAKVKDMDALNIPQSFIDAKKKKNVKLNVATTTGPKAKRVKLEGEISGKLASHLERYVDGQNCKFVPAVFNLQKMHKIKILSVYGKESFRKQMDIFFKPFFKVADFVLVSDREYNNLQNVKLHNWISMEEFIKGETKPFKRVATAYLIEDLSDKYCHAFGTNHSVLEVVSSSLYNKIEILSNYEKKHIMYSDSHVKRAILDIAEPNLLFDMEVYHIYKEVKKVLEDLPFINTICEVGNGVYEKGVRKADPKWVSVMKDLFRFNKRRMDWKNYNITLNEDVVSPITEEVIDAA